MPELPVVEFTRKLIEANALNKKVSDVVFIGRNMEKSRIMDDIIFKDTTETFWKSIVGDEITAVYRWGKQVFITWKLGTSTLLCMHLGMTAFIQFKSSRRLYYESSPSSKGKSESKPDWPPRFTKLKMVFEDGEEMVFADARRLGRVKCWDMKDVNIKDDEFSSSIKSIAMNEFKLGFDPIILGLNDHDAINLFKTKLAKTRRNLKQVLLDQSMIAGIGNWMADDILLQAALHPLRTGDSLTEYEVKQLIDAIIDISRISTIETNADKRLFPRHWIFHVRWDDSWKKAKPALECIKVGGRSTFYHPHLQKL